MIDNANALICEISGISERQRACLQEYLSSIVFQKNLSDRGKNTDLMLALIIAIKKFNSLAE